MRSTKAVGFFTPHFAQQTGFSADDLAHLLALRFNACGKLTVPPVVVC